MEDFTNLKTKLDFLDVKIKYFNLKIDTLKEASSSLKIFDLNDIQKLISDEINSTKNAIVELKHEINRLKSSN